MIDEKLWQKIKSDYSTLNFIKQYYDNIVDDYGKEYVVSLLDSLDNVESAVKQFKKEKNIIPTLKQDERTIK